MKPLIFLSSVENFKQFGNCLLLNPGINNHGFPIFILKAVIGVVCFVISFNSLGESYGLPRGQAPVYSVEFNRANISTISTAELAPLKLSIQIFNYGLDDVIELTPLVGSDPKSITEVSANKASGNGDENVDQGCWATFQWPLLSSLVGLFLGFTVIGGLDGWVELYRTMRDFTLDIGESIAEFIRRK